MEPVSKDKIDLTQSFLVVRFQCLRTWKYPESMFLLD